MLARILTENKNYQDIMALINEAGFNAATIIKAEGLWEGKTEHSLIIEIDICNSSEIIAKTELRDFHNLAWSIKKVNKQQAVLVQYLQCESKLI